MSKNSNDDYQYYLPNKNFPDGTSNLISFCENHNNDKFIEMFESINFDPSVENNILSRSAIMSDNVKILSYLLNKGANISNEDMYNKAFCYGIGIDMVKFLFDYGIDFITSAKFISYCIRNDGNEDIIEFLLKQGMDPNRFLNARDKHLIDIAAKNYNMTAVKILISYGADPSLCTSKCLALAIRTGEEELIRLLLIKGAQPSSVTPEDLSIMLGSRPPQSLIEFLVGQEFDLSVVNDVKIDKPHIDKICPMLFELGVNPVQLIKIYDKHDEEERRF